MDKKNALRAGAVTAGSTLMMLLMTSPALAVTRDDGDDPGPGLSIGETLGLYVAAPIVLFLVIAGLVMVCSTSRARTRPDPTGQVLRQGFRAPEVRGTGVSRSRRTSGALAYPGCGPRGHPGSLRTRRRAACAAIPVSCSTSFGVEALSAGGAPPGPAGDRLVGEGDPRGR
ncbi:predicted protein [Streptomyces sp. C]|nr:predicted protein [Streptomyces sp. C]